MKKRILGMLMALTFTLGSAIPAMAETVWYNGTAVDWTYGRTMGVFSFSKVQSSVYEHSATANSTFSGWQLPGTEAYAKQFVGTGDATAYWNCR